jgi:hypothetical protein
MPRYKLKPEVDIESWIFDCADVIFTDDLLLVAAAPPKTKLKAIGDKLGSNAGGISFAFGWLGGAVAITASALGEVSEKLYGATANLDVESADTLFAAGLLIYGSKRDVTFRMFNLKKPIFYTYQEVLVSGTFQHVAAELNICLPFSDDALFNERKVRTGFEAGGCKMHSEEAGSVIDVLRLLDQNYPWRYSKGSKGREWERRG